MSELLILASVALPAFAGALAWLSPARRAARLALVALVLGAIAAFALAAMVFGGGTVTAFGGLAVIDALGAYTLVLVMAVALVAALASPSYLAGAGHGAGSREPSRYYALLAWFVAGLAAVPLLDNLGLVWVGIEATTIVSALLVGFARTPAAIEAAWKYLVLGSIGIGFALLGTLLLYASSVGVLGETSDALDWTRIMGIAPLLDDGLVRLAFVFALAGYGTKAGLAPFHTWLPDAHSQAPSPISALLSGASLAVALYALARFHLVTASAVGASFSSGLLVAFGLLSLAVALPFIVVQADLKRLLAYSSIEHIGLAALALGFGGQLALAGLALHLICHGLAKSTVFLAAGRLIAESGSHRISRLGGSLSRSPTDARVLLVGAVILAGLPPSGIFVAELAIIFGGVATGWGLVAAAAAAILALTFAGLLFQVMRVVVGNSVQPRSARRSRLWPALLGVPLGLVVVAGLWTPAPLGAVIDQVVSVLTARGGS